MSLLRHPRVLPLLVAGAFFMEFLDGTVIATALPAMARDFGVRPADLSIGLSAYLVTLALLLPASGWAAERFGGRRVFAGAIAVFTLASVACAGAQGLATFTLARVVQGAGGALMVPVGRLAVLRATPKRELMGAIATLTWPALVAPIVAPPLGGFITAAASWRLIFVINVPLGIAALALALRVVPAGRGDAGRHLDLKGLALTGLAALMPLAAVELLGRDTVEWSAVAALALLGLGFGALARRHLARHPAPILTLGALRIRSFTSVALGGSLFRVAVSAVPFLLPLLFQVGFGLDPFRSGLYVLVLFVGNMGMKPMTSAVLRRFGFRRVTVGNGLLAALSILSLAALSPETPLPLVIGLLALAGMTRSMGLTTLNTLAFADVPPAELPGANTLFTMLQQMSFGLGVAVGAVALRVAQPWRPAGAAHATLTEFHIAFGIVALVALAAALDGLGLPRDAGAEVARG